MRSHRKRVRRQYRIEFLEGRSVPSRAGGLAAAIAAMHHHQAELEHHQHRANDARDFAQMMREHHQRGHHFAFGRLHHGGMGGPIAGSGRSGGDHQGNTGGPGTPVAMNNDKDNDDDNGVLNGVNDDQNDDANENENENENDDNNGVDNDNDDNGDDGGVRDRDGGGSGRD